MTPFLGEFLSLPSWWTTIAGALCVVHEVLSLVIPTQYAKFVETVEDPPEKAKATI